MMGVRLLVGLLWVVAALRAAVNVGGRKAGSFQLVRTVTARQVCYT